MAKESGKSFIKVIIIVLALGIVAVVTGVILAIKSEPKEFQGISEPLPIANTEVVTSEEGTTSTSSSGYTSWDNSIVYNDVVYYPRRNITTLLFLGIEQDSYYEGQDVLGNGGRADAIMLFILDHSNQTIDVLEVNRDAWTEVDVYTDDDHYLYSGDMQLCLQYSFANNPQRSSELMMEKVSEILYGMDINYYCSLTIEGMISAIEELGGLEITFDTDYTEIDPAFQEGSTVQLTPFQVNRLLRCRDITELGSNEGRMGRASLVMRQAFNSIKTADLMTILSCYNAVGDQVNTDLSIYTMYRFRNYHLNNIYTIPGEYVEGQFHDEYFFDEEQLQNLIIQLFYQPAE